MTTTDDVERTLNALLGDVRGLVERRAEEIAAERIAAAEDRAAEMQTSLDLCLADLLSLRAAARAILPAAAHGIAEAYVRSQGDAYQAAYDALAALLGVPVARLPVEVGKAAKLGLDVARMTLGET